MKTKIFLGSLPSNADRKVLLSHFEQYGKIKSLKLLMKAKVCSGCAILVCLDEDTRDRILNSQHRVFNRIIECHEYKRGNKLKSYNQDLWKKRVFVKNIPLGFSNIQFKEAFEVIGGVIIASINQQKTGMV
jgi:RNA recognition motif-containing protein